MTEADSGAPSTWRWSCQTRSPILVLELLSGPGSPAFRVWDPSDGVTKLLPAEAIVPIGDAPALSPSCLLVAATAARIDDAIARNVLLAPLDALVMPLPHQNTALARAMARDPVSLLLADEVGLGKTIEAGLIIRELKLRGRVRRVLVVAPKGLVGQWVADMSTHFAESFELLLPSDQAARSAGRPAEFWRHCDQVVTSLDAVKPLAARQGWSPQQVARYNTAIGWPSPGGGLTRGPGSPRSAPRCSRTWPSSDGSKTRWRRRSGSGWRPTTGCCRRKRSRRGPSWCTTLLPCCTERSAGASGSRWSSWMAWRSTTGWPFAVRSLHPTVCWRKQPASPGYRPSPPSPGKPSSPVALPMHPRLLEYDRP